MPPATRRAALDATLILPATPDEAGLIIACAQTGAQDLLSLARACCRFAIKCIAAPAAHRNATSGGTAAAAQQAEMWSIAEEAGRRWVLSCTDQERGWVPRCGRESWLGLMWEVESLRRGAAVFGRSPEDITLSEGGSRATMGVNGAIDSAASKAVMRAGRHYLQFTAVKGSIMLFGVIRPGWDVEGGEDAPWEDGHCSSGREGDRIGMLLDLDQGSMAVYKNDERLGVMATGLSGEYCWAVAMFAPGDSVRIDVAALPAALVDEI
jgi:hypothetical protein